MTHCIRCPTSYHRKCAAGEALTTRTFLCARCYGATPKGLNAPDPVMAAHVKHTAHGALELPGEEGVPSLEACFVKA
eukprot:2041892-Prymnesium_polylepis.1